MEHVIYFFLVEDYVVYTMTGSSSPLDHHWIKPHGSDVGHLEQSDAGARWVKKFSTE